jgi:hypothetical protein
MMLIDSPNGTAAELFAGARAMARGFFIFPLGPLA